MGATGTLRYSYDAENRLVKTCGDTGVGVGTKIGVKLGIGIGAEGFVSLEREEKK